MPGIDLRLFAFEKAPEKVDEKNQLGSDGDEGCDGNEEVNRGQGLQKIKTGQLRIAAWIARHAQKMHGRKDGVDADEGEPEVHLSPELTHLPAEHLGKPIIGPSKDSKNGGYTHNDVKMGHHKVGVVQIDIG